MVHEEEHPAVLVLPAAVMTPGDVGRMLREAQAIEDYLSQAKIRTPGSTPEPYKSSRLLEEFLVLNKLDGLQTTDRQQATLLLKNLQKKGPVLRISFAVDPSALFLQKLIVWLRQKIHPQLLLQIGLEPNQSVGCTVRTTNKYYDFSLRQKITDKRELLISILRESLAKSETPEPQA